MNSGSGKVADKTKGITEAQNTVELQQAQSRAQEILGCSIEFIPSAQFTDPKRTKEFSADALPCPVAETVAPPGLPPYLSALYETPLLTFEAEQKLFAKLNYYKFEACRLRETINPRRPRITTLNRIEGLVREAAAVRNQIVQANLRLVVAIAKKFVEPTAGLDELISEGHLPLIRAVELFDYSRGNRFSTYATWAVRNHLVRTVTELRKRQTRYSTSDAYAFENVSETRSAVHESEGKLQRQRKLVERYLGQLQPREQKILAARFGLDEHGHPHTLSEIGRDFGISKERVRQVAIRALDRLRGLAAGDVQEAV